MYKESLETPKKSQEKFYFENKNNVEPIQSLEGLENKTPNDAKVTVSFEHWYEETSSWTHMRRTSTSQLSKWDMVNLSKINIHQSKSTFSALLLVVF